MRIHITVPDDVAEQARIFGYSQAESMSWAFTEAMRFLCQVKQARKYEEVTGRCSRCGRTRGQKK